MTGVEKKFKVKWGLLGAGDIVKKRVAPAFAELNNSELIAVNRARNELAEQFAKHFGIPKWYDKWNDLINDDEIEAVYIATPVNLHCEQAVAAAKAGKHVLCEKPMALTVDECDMMMKAAEDNNVKLGIAYYRHLYPMVNRIKEIISGGEIGEVIISFVKAFEFFNPSPGEPRYWFVEKEKAGGGPMFDFGCHRIEFLLNLFGKVKEVKSILGNVSFDRQVEDTASAILEFENSSQSILSVTHSTFESKDSVSVYGTKGSLEIPVLNGSRIIIKNLSGEKEEIINRADNVHLPLINNFSVAVLNGVNPVVTADMGREVNVVLEKIYNNNQSSI